MTPIAERYATRCDVSQFGESTLLKGRFHSRSDVLEVTGGDDVGNGIAAYAAAWTLRLGRGLVARQIPAQCACTRGQSEPAELG